MKYKKLYFAILFTFFVFTFNASSTSNIKENESTIVLIQTDLGTIKIKLYNETPLHRDNFIKLINEQQYNDETIHRILQDFVIEVGDYANSKSSSTIPAEINQQLFHKKGALVASRKEDVENPNKVSLGKEFFIVQGSVYSETMLKTTALRITKTKLFNEIINRSENDSLQNKYRAYAKAEQLDSLSVIQQIITKQVEAELPKTDLYVFSEEQINTYSTIGGCPHLDGSYTVFGEVIEGLEIIDLLAKQPVKNDGIPLKIIKINISVLQ